MPSQPAVRRGYAEVTWAELAKIALIIIQLPFVLVYQLITSPFVEHNSTRPWIRILVDSLFRHLTWSTNIHELQWVFKTPGLNNYADWTKKNDLPYTVDEIGEDARLFWVGPKRTDKVILYFHGGAYMLPMQEHHMNYVKHVREQLKLKGIDIAGAMLNYTLVPNGTFPTQLKQMVAAVKHLIASGAKPEDIRIMGDSAGGNLIIQLLLHILHPVEGVPPLNLNGRLGGAYLMSPWTSIAVRQNVTKGKHHGDTTDIINSQLLSDWSQAYLTGVSDSHTPYINHTRTPEVWYQGVDKVVERILVTAGDLECLRDDIISHTDILKKYHKKVDLVVQENGLHEDLLLDFAAAGSSNPSSICELTPLSVTWLVSSFNGGK
ncbi:hypothetical protein AX16_004924 [Volvariella volvacea WC 439]|nr:hypothetical protein AX16_004924 [Volvariella volvacea WC 439]